MPWYKEDNEIVLDYTKPIFCKRPDLNIVEILLPIHEEQSYKTIGYDWFNLTNGRWDSCVHWESIEAAVKGRSYKDNLIFNAETAITQYVKEYVKE